MIHFILPLTNHQFKLDEIDLPVDRCPWVVEIMYADVTVLHRYPTSQTGAKARSRCYRGKDHVGSCFFWIGGEVRKRNMHPREIRHG